MPPKRAKKFRGDAAGEWGETGGKLSVRGFPSPF